MTNPPVLQTRSKNTLASQHWGHALHHTRWQTVLRVRVGNNGQRQRTGKICISSHHILQIYISTPTHTWKITFFFLKIHSLLKQNSYKWASASKSFGCERREKELKPCELVQSDSSETFSELQRRNNSSVVTCAIRIQVNRTNNKFKATLRVYSHSWSLCVHFLIQKRNKVRLGWSEEWQRAPVLRGACFV